MALKFLGHAPSFQVWVFELDGKQFVARNFSTQNPLMIKFVGNYPDTYAGGAGLVKTSGFDIISGTSQPSAGGIAGVVEWLWMGNRYRNTYFFNIGDIGEDEESTLQFAAPIPYNGAAGGTIGSPGIESDVVRKTKALVQGKPTPPPNTEAINETVEALKKANEQLSISEAQRKVDSVALNNARVELRNAEAALVAAEARGSATSAALLAQLREQVQVTQDRADVQIKVLQRALAEGKTAMEETVEALRNANKQLEVSESQRKVDVRALNEARAELDSAKVALAAAESRATATNAAVLAQLREQVQVAQDRADVQVQTLQRALAEGQTALAETAGSLEAAKQSLAVSEAQGRVNLDALNNARIELENVKASMAVAEVRLSQTQAAALARMREEIEAAQSRADAQIAAMRTAMAAQQQQQTPPVSVPVVTTPPMMPPVTSPVFTPPKATPGVEVAPPSGTDWVKLGLQLGAAYLLLS